jgi:hypothetical protein
MKTITISILTISVFSNVAFASSNRSYELWESPTYCGQYTKNSGGHCFSNTDDTRPFRTEKKIFSPKPLGRPRTSYERMMDISNKNDHGRH